MTQNCNETCVSYYDNNSLLTDTVSMYPYTSIGGNACYSDEDVTIAVTMSLHADVSVIRMAMENDPQITASIGGGISCESRIMNKTNRNAKEVFND